MMSKRLFPAHVLYAMNAIQHLRALHLISEVRGRMYSTAPEIAREIHAPLDSLTRTMPILVRMGLVSVHTGASGGYCIVPEELLSTRVIDVLNALGATVSVNETTRGSDRLNALATECFNVTLNDFLK